MKYYHQIISKLLCHQKKINYLTLHQLSVSLFGKQDWVKEVSRGQSYKANFGIDYIKKGLNKLNFTLNYINFDVIYAKKVL